MKLEYNILWLDNDLRDYIDNGDVDSIHDFLVNLGFEPNIITVFDEANLEEYLNINYDLIISDFNLNKENGDVIIYRLRNERKLDTEILFYSAKSNFMDDEQVKNQLAFMERINIQIGRDTLLDKIEKVIELTIHKLLELDATRGLITSATSSLDVLIEELTMDIVFKHLELKQEELDGIIDHYIKDFLEKSPQKFRDKYEEVGFESWFHRIEASRKWQIFRKLLKKLKQHDEVGKFLDVNKTYNADVIDIRNKFAHAKSEEVEGVIVLKGQLSMDDFTFDKNACIEIRRKLINHKKSFEDLKKFLTESVAST